MAEENTQNISVPPEEEQVNVQEEQTASQSEGVVKTLLQHKQLVLFFIVGFVILFTVIILSLASLFTVSDSTTTPVDVTPTPANEVVIPTDVELLPTDIYPIESPTPTPTESTEAQEIKTQIKPELDKTISTGYEISVMKIYQNGWAKLYVSSNETGKAAVVVKKVNGVWEVALGPGTYFDAEELKAIGATQEVIDDLTR